MLSPVVGAVIGCILGGVLGAVMGAPPLGSNGTPAALGQLNLVVGAGLFGIVGALAGGRAAPSMR